MQNLLRYSDNPFRFLSEPDTELKGHQYMKYPELDLQYIEQLLEERRNY